jgi:hypothetical protein
MIQSRTMQHRDTITRRRVLAAGAATAVATAATAAPLAAATDAEADAALIKLCDAACALDDQINKIILETPDDEDEPDYGDQWDRFEAMCAEIEDMRATTLHGMQAKARVLKRRLPTTREGTISPCAMEQEHLAWSLASCCKCQREGGNNV